MMSNAPTSSSVCDAPPWSKAGLIFAVHEERYLFVANGSRLYGVDTDFAEIYDALVQAHDECGLDRLLAEQGLSDRTYVDDVAPSSFPVHAISLAVAQKCNLGCTYCYAREGDFGGAPKNMPREVAFQSIDNLFEEVPRGGRINIAFLGGEPLINRAVLRDATEYAAALGSEKDVEVGFSITTNGTLLKADDTDFFERYRFAVTISLDGIGEVHNQQRAFKGGRGSFDSILQRVTPMLSGQRRMQVSARVTVTPKNLNLLEALDYFVELGFFSVGFSPMLSSPTGRGEMGSEDLAVMLRQMIACGRKFEAELIAGRRYPFLNMITALKELHRGTHRPYPCGAGAGYLGVSAEGAYSACHRFVDDLAGAMGTVQEGVDRSRQRHWLADRHVHRQSPCSECGARYLCGGGCHHEVISRGRPACDYIRGWLAYCLEAYVRLSLARPDFFSGDPSDGRPPYAPPA